MATPKKKHPKLRGTRPRHGLTVLARERGMTICMLAARCDTACARLNNIAAGNDELSYPLLRSIARVLRVPQRVVFDAWRTARRTYLARISLRLNDSEPPKISP